jgi:glycosyltransferase involved in cell wall biosynthesis
MRVLWISDSPDTPSGFGNVTRFVCEGLAARGHQVHILGWQTREPHEWNGCSVLPASGYLGNRSLYPFLVRHRPEIVVALGDVWWLPFFAAPHVRRQMQMSDTPWALYFPIDGNMQDGRLPPSWIQLLQEVDIPIAMSEFGRNAAQSSGVACQCIPHGVDRSFFYPPSDREQAKAAVDAAGKFLVLSDSRNQPRKMLPRLLDVFAKFAADRTDVLLHLHTDPDDEFTKSGLYAYDIRADLRSLGLEDKVRFTPGMKLKRGGGVPLEQLAQYYRAADVHLLASSGEGFGLPTLQAAAAGAVPLAGDYSASHELVDGHGQAIAISEWSENEFGIRRGFIDVDDAVRQLVMFYDDRPLLMARSRRSAEFANDYEWPKILDQWDVLLRSVSSRQRRISRVPVARPLPAALSHRFAPQVGAGSIQLSVVEHKFGQLEASILADTRGHLSDVRIPAIQKSCEVAGLRVVRTGGYLAVAPGDEAVFLQLQCIFPGLAGWSPMFTAGTAASGIDHLEFIHLTQTEAARYHLAQSVLLLNVSGKIPDAMLQDAALYGVPCIGTPDSSVQATLWPDLTTNDSDHAFRLARSLLTNAARLRKVSIRGRCEGKLAYDTNEQDAATWLRRLHS